jgi:hypothetical protein
VEHKELILPPSVISQADVTRLIRELNGLNDFFVDANARASGTPIQPRRLSRMLDQTAKTNGYNLLQQPQRDSLITELEAILQKAPMLHISFAAEPSPKSLEPILAWFRQNIHPQALLTVGLQPTIAAGCVLRTPNRWFDMSMREYLRKQEPYLAELIEGVASGK